MTDRSTNKLMENSIEITTTKSVKGILKKPTNYLMRSRSSGSGPFMIEKKVTF